MPKKERNLLVKKIGRLETAEGFSDYLEDKNEPPEIQDFSDFDEKYFFYNLNHLLRKRWLDDLRYELNNAPPEMKDHEIVRQTVERYCLKFLHYGDVASASILKSVFELSADFIESSECQAALVACCALDLANKRQQMLEMADNFFGLSPDILGRAKITAHLKSRAYRDQPFYYADDVYDENYFPRFHLSEDDRKSPEMERLAKDEMIKLLSQGSVVSALVLAETFHLFSKQLAGYPDLYDAVKEAMIGSLAKGDKFSFYDISQTLSLPENFIDRSEIEAVVKKGVLVLLADDDPEAALDLAIDFTSSKKIFSSPEIKPMIGEMLSRTLSDGEIELALSVKNDFNLPPEILVSAVQRAIVNSFSAGDQDIAFMIIEEFGSLDSAINLDSPEVRQAVKQGMIYDLAVRNLTGRVQEIEKRFAFSKEEMDEVAKESIAKALLDGSMYTSLRIKGSFNLLPDGFFSDPGFQSVSKNVLIRNLPNGDFSLIMQWVQEFNISDEIINSLEVRQAAEQRFIRCVADSIHDQAIAVKREFNLSNEIFESPAVQAAIISAITNLLEHGSIEAARAVQSDFEIPAEAIVTIVQGDLINKLERGRLESALRIREAFDLASDFWASQELHQAVKFGVGRLLSVGSVSIRDAKEMAAEFGLDQESLFEVVKEGLIDQLLLRNTQSAHKIREMFALPIDMVQADDVRQAAKKACIGMLSVTELQLAIETSQEYGLSPQEITEVAQEGIVLLLKDSRLVTAFKVKDTFGLSDEFVNSSRIQKLIKEDVINLLSRGAGALEPIIQVKERLNLADPEIVQAAKDIIVNLLFNGDSDLALRIKEVCNISDDFFNEPELRRRAVVAIGWLLDNSHLSSALAIKKYFNLSKDEVVAVVRQGVIKLLSNGTIDQALLVSKMFELSNDLMDSKEVKQAAYNGLVWLLTRGLLRRSLDIKEGFNLAPEMLDSPEVRQAVKAGMIDLLQREEFDDARKMTEEFKLPKESASDVANELTTRFVDKEKFEALIRIREILKLDRDRALEIGVDIFGSFLTADLYRGVRQYLEAKNPDEIPEIFRNIGINQIKEKGLRQFKEAVAGFKAEIKDPNYAGDHLENKFFRSLFKNSVRYESSEWGKHDDSTFNRTVDIYRTASANGLLNELPAAYQPSGVVRIDKVDRAKQLSFQYSEQFRSRYGSLRHSILEAHNLIQDRKPLGAMIKEISQVRQEVLADLEDKLLAMKEDPKVKPQAIDHLSQRVELLKTLDLRSIRDFENNFSALAKFKEFEEPLRKLIFFLSFHDFKGQRHLVADNLNADEPTIDNLAWTLEFIDHITNNEVRGKYFKDEQARNAFLKITNARSLSEEYALLQNQDTAGLAKMKFIPTRGLLMEFSGHIGDTCWASKEDCLARNHPNKSALIMVQNPETVNERLAGSCILIETTSIDGESLLVIRGLNPIENVINQLSVDDYYQKITTYLRGVAKKLNRKLAIVIDGKRGMAATNRQSVYDYLHANCRGTKVRLASSDDTAFNGYAITDTCYLIE